MNISVLKNVKLNPKTARVVGKGVILAKKHGPAILTTVGVVGVVTSAVLASKATLKLEPIIDKAHDGLAKAEDMKTKHTADEYSSLDHQKDVTYVYTVAAMDIAKLYALPVALGTVSISMIVGSHVVLHRRNVAMAAAYKTLEQTFAKYRSRVVDELGEDKDREFRLGYREEVVKGENGEETVNIVGNPNDVSGYVDFFNETNKNWVTSPDFNLNFVKSQEIYANDRLKAYGYLFLNDVRKALGLEPTKAGQVVGWLAEGDGDGFVDFGIKDFQSAYSRTFGTDDEMGDCIMLDFNVDGMILDKF